MAYAVLRIVPNYSPQRNANRFQSGSLRMHDRDVVPAKKRSHSHGDGTLLLIAVFKFVKGTLLLTLAFGALTLLHKDVASEVEHRLDQLRMIPIMNSSELS